MDNGDYNPNPLFKNLGFVFVILLILCSIGIIVVYLPTLQTPEWKVINAKEYQELINANRTVVINALTGFVVIIALYITFRRLRASEAQIELTQEQLKLAQGQFEVAQGQLESIKDGQFNERYIRAIELLKKENSSEIQIAGIIALKQLCFQDTSITDDVIGILEVFILNKSEQVPVHRFVSGQYSSNEIERAVQTIFELVEVSIIDRTVRIYNVYLYSLDIKISEFNRTSFSFEKCRIDKCNIENFSSSRFFIFLFSDCHIKELITKVSKGEMSGNIYDCIIDSLSIYGKSYSFSFVNSIVILETTFNFQYRSANEYEFQNSILVTTITNPESNSSSRLIHLSSGGISFVNAKEEINQYNKMIKTSGSGMYFSDMKFIDPDTFLEDNIDLVTANTFTSPLLLSAIKRIKASNQE